MKTFLEEFQFFIKKRMDERQMSIQEIINDQTRMHAEILG